MSTKRVGIRELRQNLSVYLRKIEHGDRFEVTDRGRPVAMLVPLPQDATALEKLIASGRATAPVGDLLELGRPEGKASTRVSEALAAERADRFSDAES
jgi:prevent-host-death family protein